MHFQDYQRVFTARIRDPGANPRPRGVPAERMRVYELLVYNTIEDFLRTCFPVCREVLGARRWRRLVRAFIRDHVCHSPYFRQLPEELLRYLQDEFTLPVDWPAFLPELAHHEWVELALEGSDLDTHTPPHDPQGDLIAGRPLVNPVAMLDAYRYPVHRIGRRFRPKAPPALPTFVLGYRSPDTLQVRFQVLNAPTARLLQMLREDAALTGAEALRRLAVETGRQGDAAYLASGAEMLEALRAAGVLLGTRR